MAAHGRLGGHIVQGHVDGTGTIARRTPGEAWEVVRVAVPADLARYVVEKGSITVDGTSLTVSAVSEPAAAEHWFEVSLIPATLELTVLGTKPVGATVNLEVDVLAKYVERLRAFEPTVSGSAGVTVTTDVTSNGRWTPCAPAARSSSPTTPTARTRGTPSSPPSSRRRSGSAGRSGTARGCSARP